VKLQIKTTNSLFNLPVLSNSYFNVQSLIHKMMGFKTLLIFPQSKHKISLAMEKYVTGCHHSSLEAALMFIFSIQYFFKWSTPA